MTFLFGVLTTHFNLFHHCICRPIPRHAGVSLQGDLTIKPYGMESYTAASQITVDTYKYSHNAYDKIVMFVFYQFDATHFIYLCNSTAAFVGKSRHGYTITKYVGTLSVWPYA